jgi:hypothetical protein
MRYGSFTDARRFFMSWQMLYVNPMADTTIPSGAYGRIVDKNAVPALPKSSTNAGPNIVQHVAQLRAPKMCTAAETAVAPKTRDAGLV